MVVRVRIFLGLNVAIENNNICNYIHGFVPHVEGTHCKGKRPRYMGLKDKVENHIRSRFFTEMIVAKRIYHYHGIILHDGGTKERQPL